MTQEEKQLLLKDLCARLPYEIKVEVYVKDKDIKSVDCVKYDTVGTYIRLIEDEKFSIKPYLSPLSSMTEEEKEEYNYMVFDYEYDDYWYPGKYIDAICVDGVDELVDWFNSHHFDYRGLIPMGLALPAPEDMYSTKTE